MKREGNVRILLVDDTPGNIFALEKLLEKDTRILLNASNGNDALKIAFETELDLIILDVQMPGIDGFEVAQILRSNKRTKDVPIIFATAVMKDHQFIMKGFEEGAVDYLFKPLDPEITKAKVAVLLKVQLQKKELMEKNNSLEKAEEQIRKLNSELQGNLTQLEDINKELESFSYSVSHDLRAPLRIMDTYSRMLVEDYTDKLDDDGVQLLNSIQRNALKMNDLIDALLKFSKLGRKDVQKSEVDMQKMVQTITSDLCSSIHSKAEVKLNSIMSAQADFTLLTQVWINLISNAFKYSSKKERPYIEIGSNKIEEEIIYYVKDNGVGFRMEYADKLFGVFQRLHGDNEFEGTGVGLAIVQRVITKHGGKVWAEAKVGEGSTFYFSLPDKEEFSV